MDETVIKRLALGNLGEKKKILKHLKTQADKKGIFFASILPFYKSLIKIPNPGFTIPAFNLRGLTFDLASSIFEVAKEQKLKFFIFELARSEISYTAQPPEEYAGQVLAAALASDWQGPIFLLGDHLQINPEKYHNTLIREINIVKKLIKRCLKAGFFNIDIDASPLSSLKENILTSSRLVRFTRLLKRGKNIALGVEIEEIGKEKTSSEQLKMFLEGLRKKMGNFDQVIKVAVQSGTKHGGEVLPDGTFKKMAVDFDLLKKLSKIAKSYGLAGVVQHGASTLPVKTLSGLPKVGVLEVHLGTAFQNLVFDHPDFPSDLKKEMEQFLEKKFADKIKDYQTKIQFFYETRKHAWGIFERKFVDLPKSFKGTIRKLMKKRLVEIFKALSLENTKKLGGIAAHIP